MKERTNVSIDEGLMNKARQAGLNISGEIEAALRKKFISAETAIPKEDGDKCQVCGKVDVKATRDNLLGLTWLCPDEIWICNSCLNNEARQVLVTFGQVNRKMDEKKRKEIKELASEFVNIPEIRKDILNQVKKTFA